MKTNIYIEIEKEKNNNIFDRKTFDFSIQFMLFFFSSGININENKTSFLPKNDDDDDDDGHHQFDTSCFYIDS